MNNRASLNLTALTPLSLSLSGVMDEFTVLSVLQQGCDVIDRAPSQAVLRVDLQGVISADSAGLALLLEWARYAKKQDKKLHLYHLPTVMEQIMLVSSLSEVLQIDGDNA